LRLPADEDLSQKLLVTEGDGGGLNKESGWGDIGDCTESVCPVQLRSSKVGGIFM
jgi:hypothetical protein